MEIASRDIPSSSQGFVDIGHTQVGYKKIGTGPDLLFIHGWPLNGGTWRNVTPYLDGFTRWVIDLPGTGTSTATTDTPLTVQGHVESVVKVLDGLGLSKVAIVGHDSGGMIGRYVAEKRPEVVQALSLCGTEIPGHHPFVVAVLSAAGRLPGAKAMFRFTMGNKLLARGPLALGGAFSDTSLVNGEFRTALLDPILADDSAMDAIITMIAKFSKHDAEPLAQTHPNLTMPVLLVWGEDDPFFPVEKARSMVDQFGGPTEFVTLPNCKLLVHEEYPERFAQLTRDFLFSSGFATSPKTG